MKSRNAILIAIPIVVVVALGLYIASPTLSAHYHLVTFHDKNGYQPEWVKGLNVYDVMEKCKTAPESDKDWCSAFGVKAIIEKLNGNI